MEQKKQKKISLKKEKEHEGLYSWSIHEENASKADLKSASYIPFDYSLYFTIQNLSYISSTERSNQRVEKGEEDIWNTDAEIVRGDLQFDKEFPWATMSFFGTSDEIEHY